MQHIQCNNQWEEDGTFVYRLLKNLSVRSALNVGDECSTNISFNAGDLVSVDLIRPSRIPGSANGPFLRLSDCSGWLFEKMYGEQVMERLTVATGLWVMYADNCNVGIGLHCHPFDNSPQMDPAVTYLPMQKIYCDRRVVCPTSGVKAYRVQGTEGWVFDKRIRNDGSVDSMLLPESSVKRGLFVYELLVPIGIRSEPSTCDESRTQLSIKTNELVACDVIRQSPSVDGNGPFVRLTDGSGWLFERKKGEFDAFLRSIPIETGCWTLKVLNDPAGIILRRQPIDNSMKYDRVFAPGEQVKCDRKVRATNGTIFYRVEQTDGWVFDKRENRDMMELLYETKNENLLSSSVHGNHVWDLGFLRGIAFANSLTEISCNAESRVISFQSEDGTRINVYYTTRTIGTALDYYSAQGKVQIFRRNCSDEELLSIIRDPGIRIGKEYQRKRSRNSDFIMPTHTQHGMGVVLEEEEEERRTALVDIDKKIEELEKKRTGMKKALKKHDDKRAQVAKHYEDKRLELKEAAAAESRRIQEAAAAEIRRIQEAAAKERREREERTCSVCDRVFVDKHARDQHFQAAHIYRCDCCYREFNSLHSLNQHRDALGHW